jgi:glycosyltransferase involved in cell wall biosynthesis
MVNILILHQHFKTPQTGGALRSYFLATAAVGNGWQVNVVTGASQRNYSVDNVEGILVHNVPVHYSNYFGFWKRILAFVNYLRWCIKLAQKLKHADVCYAISVPLTTGLAARWLKWRYNIPYIFEVGDLWPDAPIELDVIINPVLKKYLWTMEKRIYQEAKSVVALSPAIQSAIEKKAPGTSVHMIPNMADVDFFKPETKSGALEEKFGVKGKLVVSYFGAMGFANGLEALLHAAEKCQQAQLPVHFLLAGDGVEQANLNKLAKQLALTNLTFHGFQDRSGIGELMNVTDVVFVSFRPAAILETGSPNKLFDGLAAGKMILVNFKGWLLQELIQSGCGAYVNTQIPKALSLFLAELIKGGKLAGYQKAARELAKNKYSRAACTQQWLNILQTGEA